ncbi:NAD(P)/FAD-dependent oxidoreductase [Xenorhabdus anantnagensis]|uniref:FAD-dependent oxidoreductase n=1 Tax=Xenorhabdus anantnagensis TaxID=3025875 RepID=A0ABT5LTB3_9GAMM|nr:FAD-dependent oxidoreductase [Xenorhabdus anantnagensis]MDC9596961.1 FAD-dependent oxidoreductase [Xenorhabdus anantnagensis]
MNYDVIVVGSGAIAGSIAYELASRQLKVCRLGRLDRSNAASKAAGAMNGCFGEVTSGLVASDYGKLKLKMDRIAKDRWSIWAQRLVASSGDTRPLFTAKGTHVILNTAGMAAVDSVNYDAIESTLREYNEPYEVVDPQSIKGMKANDLVRSLKGLYISEEHALNSHILLEMLDAAFLREGGEIVDNNVKRVLTENGTITGVETVDGARFTANKVVIAAGVQSLDILSDQLSIVQKIPPLFAGYGVSVLLKVKNPDELPTSVIRTPNRAFACGLHCVPRGDGVLYVGATNLLSNQPRTHATVATIQFLVECAYNQINVDLFEAEVLAIQVGNRPISADGFPLIGECGIDGLWLVTGTYRDGLHQSPLLADYAANALMGLPNLEIDLGDFTPIRRPLIGLDRDMTILEAAQQTAAMGYECLWNIRPGWNELIHECLLNKYRAQVESIDAIYTPPPDLVAFSCHDEQITKRLRDYYNCWKE